MSEPTIGLALPTIPPRRANELPRALVSVVAQTRLPDRISIVTDHGHNGAPITRNAAWRALGDVDYVAFLDDDDEWHPEFLRKTLGSALTTGADITYPWFELPGYPSPLFIQGQPAEGHPFDDVAREEILTSSNFIPVTTLIRRSALEAVDGFPLPNSERWPHDAHEDWGMWRAMLNEGFTFHHLPERLWTWHWWESSPGVPGNTSGRAW